MGTHVALLRGINVGGRKLAMADLREIITTLGHADVSTYIQSGNALFSTARPDTAELAREIEKGIADRLGMDVGVIVLSRADLGAMIAASPYADEPDPKTVHGVVMSTEPGSDRWPASRRCRSRAGIPGITTVGSSISTRPTASGAATWRPGCCAS
jgi:uncharacterized protein (DUF1697 family)